MTQTLNSFPEKWDNEEYIIKFQVGTSYTQEVFFDGSNYKAYRTLFENVIFEKDFIIRNALLSGGISFKNCKFLGKFEISDSSVHYIEGQGSMFLGQMEFFDCKFREEFAIKGMPEKKIILGSSIRFQRCTFSERFLLLGIKSSHLFIENCKMKNRASQISMIDCEHLFITDLIAPSIGFYMVNGSVTIRDVTFEFFLFGLKDFPLTIQNSLFTGVVLIELFYTNQNNLLEISNCEFKKLVTIFSADSLSPNSTGNNNSEIRLIDINAEGGLSLSCSTYEAQSDDLLILKKLKLGFSNRSRGELKIDGIRLKELELKGYNTFSNVTFNALEVDAITIEDFTNNSGLRFIGLHPSNIKKSSLKVKNSQLGNTFFANVSFDKYETVEVNSVNLSSINSSLVRWFKPHQLNVHKFNQLIGFYKDGKIKFSEHISALRDYFQEQGEIYRQLKIASEKEGNIPLSLEFKRHEMEFYRRSIKTRYKIFKSKKIYPAPINQRSNKATRSEKLILWSNRTNDFGQSWVRAVSWLVCASIACSVPLCLVNSPSLNASHFASSQQDWIESIRIVCRDIFKYLPLVLNPAHTIKDVKEVANLPGVQSSIGTYYFDLFSRIVVSYFIFQTVVAFRKFSK